MITCAFCGQENEWDKNCKYCGAELPDTFNEKYCTRCGKKLITKKTAMNKFNINTGEQYYKFDERCPDHKHFMDRHTRNVWNNSPDIW